MNNLLFIPIILFIIIKSIFIPFQTDKTYKEENNKLEIKEVKEIEEDNDEVLLTIEIKKIGLKQKVLNIDSKKNNIEENVTIIKESKLPYVKNGNLILGAHSGPKDIAYFNDLIKLEKGDLIIITHNNIKYVYKINSIYDDDKNSKIIIRRDINKNTLTLFTCKNNNKKYYLVIIAYLEEKTE